VTKCNPANERVKRKYVLFLKDAKGRGEESIDAAAAAIDRFDEFNRRKDFKAFHFEQARLQNASGVVDQRANRRAFVRLDRKRDARLAQGVLHMASGSTRLCVANQVFWRGIFQHAWQRVESSDRAPVQTVRDARRCSRHARCHS
jgi:hypothetical protein